MRLASVTVFDKDLNSKGRDLPATHRPKSDQSQGVRAPRPDQKNNLVEDAAKSIRSEEATPLSTVKKATLEAHLKRITADADPELRKGGQALDSIQSELDDWLELVNEGRQDYQDMGGNL